MTDSTPLTRHLPALVLVGGAPATGKSTLAGLLAADLRLPLLSKDLVKEAMLGTLGTSDLARSRELGAAAYAVLYAVVSRVLEAGSGAVVDSNFARGLAEAELRPLAARASTVLVHCQTSSAEIVRRYVERAARGERHPGHLDAAALPDLLRHLDAGVYEPLDLQVPTLRVDTTAGYAPGLAEIVAFVVAGNHAGPLKTVDS